MMLHVKYFGGVADVTHKTEESFTFDSGISLSQFKSEVEKKYPAINQFVYAIAVNRTIMNEEIILKSEDELALLPPFAGG